MSTTTKLEPLPELQPGTPDGMRPRICGLLLIAQTERAILVRRDGGGDPVWFPRRGIRGQLPLRPNTGDTFNMSVTTKLYREKAGKL